MFSGGSKRFMRLTPIISSFAACEGSAESTRPTNEGSGDAGKKHDGGKMREEATIASGNSQKYMGPYCHMCEEDGKDWSTLKYTPSVISTEMTKDDLWNVFMAQSVCGNYWRLWSQTKETAESGGEGAGEEAVKVANDALKECMKRNSAYYETVHDEEVEESDPLPPGPKLEPDEDWSDLPDDELTGCSLCIFMRGSPCGNHFRCWDKCVKENPEDYTKTCFEVSKKMFECNNSVEFKAFQEADKHNKSVRKEWKDKRPTIQAREDMLTTMRWEFNSIIKPSPDLIPNDAIDFGDEFRVDLRHVLDDEGYEQKQHGEWKKEREGNTSVPVTHCYVKDRQNNLLGFTTLGKGIRNVRDLTCKRNSGILRGRLPIFEGDVDVFIKRGNIIYKTAVKLVSWEDRDKAEKEAEGKEEAEDKKEEEM